MVQEITDAFPGQFHPLIVNFFLFRFLFGEVEAHAVAYAEGAFMGEAGHGGFPMPQNAEEKVYRRQAAHGDFIDEIGGHGGKRLLVTALQGVHDGLVEEDAFGGITVW